MTPERWKRIEELFHAASALPPDAHRAFLVASCPDDERLQGDVEALLNESASEEGFLARRAVVTASQFVVNAAPGAMTGRSIGGYHLQSLLGAGGMGEVYRSRDAKLGRDVAIKILPRAFTSDPDRLARFEREARMLAALNHPGICAIYGFEEADGVRFLVLELVEGETLAARIASARMRSDEAGLSIPEALAIARQIAEALEVAHDKGIIHRDLKPANVTITPDGLVKVLDFGLAKVVGGDGATPDITHVPLAPEAGGREGAVIGTAAYMSPEQARGQPVDKRSDIWSFGCVLYEMLAGRVTFAGDTDVGLDRKDPRARARLDGVACRDTCADSTAPAPLPGKGSEAAPERYWRRADRDRRDTRSAPGHSRRAGSARRTGERLVEVAAVGGADGARRGSGRVGGLAQRTQRGRREPARQRHVRAGHRLEPARKSRRTFRLMAGSSRSSPTRLESSTSG